jgi:DNA segregation ATPase FtsK/SpoIIIE-like protein
MTRNIVNEGVALKTKMFDDSGIDELFKKAAEVVIQYDRASASLLQRRLGIGYARAARLIDQLEAAGILGPMDGSKPREVLIRSSEDVRIPKSDKEDDEIEPVYDYKPITTTAITQVKDSPWKNTLFNVLNKHDFKNIYNFSFPIGFKGSELITSDLQSFTHLSITGNISSRKESLVDTILLSLLMKLSPTEFKLIISDQSRYFNLYDNLPHLLAPVINEYGKTVSALRWTMSEMDRRFKLFAQHNVRELLKYNEINSATKLPQILYVMNHVEEEMVFAPVEVEDSLTRLTSVGHKVGIHILVVSDRHTKDEIPMKVQANITNKIFFRLTNRRDSGQVNLPEVDKLIMGEAVFISDFENENSKIDAIYSSEDNIKTVVESLTKSTS